MAAVEITISGVLYDKHSRTTRPVVLIGEASYTGVGIGGGPIIPDVKPPEPPLGIWGPDDPRPGYGLPGWGDGKPPEPPPAGGVKPPPPGGGWGYHPEYGWGYFPGPGEAGPKAKTYK